MGVNLGNSGAAMKASPNKGEGEDFILSSSHRLPILSSPVFAFAYGTTRGAHTA